MITLDSKIQKGEKDSFVLSFSHLSFVVSDEFVKDGLYSVYPNKFVSAFGLHYLCHNEDRMRFDIANSEMRFPFAFALTFRYICKHEYRIRFGIVKSEI